MNALLKIPYLRLKYRFFPNSAQKFWGQELLNSQGITAKVGQILAQGKESELPKSSIGISAAKELFKKNFQRDISIETEAQAASMGQVFSIKLDNRTLALKILHPGLKDKLKKEIKNILVLGSYFAKSKGFKFDKDLFQHFLTDVFEEETNLVREAEFQKKFVTLFNSDTRFCIPRVVPAFSNENMLCQEWLDSTLARDVLGFPHFDIFHFFFKSLLGEGLLHGDLNDRNWGINSSKQVVVYDYGCSQAISDLRINALKKLIMGKDTPSAFKELGLRLDGTWFEDKQEHLREALFKPFQQSSIEPDWNYSQELEAQFGDKIKLLRESTDPWVLLMLRSLFSLIRIYHRQGISIPLRELVSPYMQLKNDPEQIIRLHVEVIAQGKSDFYMTFPFAAVRNMELYIPPQVKTKLAEDGLELNSIVERAIEKGPVAQNLIDVLIGDRRHRVWLDK